MKTKLQLIVTTIILLQITACNKVWDYIKNHPDGYADDCKIDKIYFFEYYPDVYNDDQPTLLFRDTANFVYDSRGLLIAIDYASTSHNLHVDPYPTINFTFAYNSQKQLIGYFERSRMGEPDFRYSGMLGHKYVYLSNNTIIDSTFENYVSAELINDNLYISADFVRVDTILLDSWGRIAKRGNETYRYDASGNLVKSGVRYTSKKNILQTDKTLMFVTQDYSLNTAVNTASVFNSEQLPIEFLPRRIPDFFVTSINYPYTQEFKRFPSTVVYKCK